ncbi:hypothetical protein MITS9509_02728 [Synechococcus sp. MIT S9509]|uniref:hypothetical protein n=1 Tax=unclassified Synechococcus TaxID=2626047 RepID=UPI0007BBD4CD|nr:MULTISPECIES: hypothetical protein [unclassified Synechococcus]KZR85545.1 hypothetical protein MITS9504_02082 [Synechococcus sp. MIT S9504]KZR90439.1 hypothetical protein MITS9509_02728 [Synechococcus sp. MIT S9509]
MKFISFLGALVLSVSPGFAGNYVYLNCEVEVVNTKTDLDANNVLEENSKTGSIVFKVDLDNSRSMGAGASDWEDIQIVDGVIRDLRIGEVDGFRYEAKRAVRIQPPGKFSVNTVALSDKILVTISTEGQCSEIDALVFDEAK